LVAVGDDRGPMFVTYFTNEQISRIISRSCRDLDPIRVFPKSLGFSEIDPVLSLVRFALVCVVFEFHNRIINILLLYQISTKRQLLLLVPNCGIVAIDAFKKRFPYG